MRKVDLKRERKTLYTAPAGQFVLIEVPPMPFLMIDGHGSPDAPPFAEAMEALFSVAYGLKFMSKVECQSDYTVPPMEGLWWAERYESFYDRDKDLWSWRIMVPQPDWITPDMFARAVVGAGRKGKGGVALGRLRLETYDEGLSVQTLHLGSYDEEGPLIARLHEWLRQNGLAETHPHHEIYLSDPRRTAPEKLKTLLRQPVRRLSSSPA
ncbi:GyrI-like domain-containing protein [Asticcacaulis sp. AND118]|uniref:GyrI-like domain-containing protein n=1 Tax=Asticcacaulis sp. AND118 TaxID=2840468 RepID=UPI001CFFB589|nr:GyrI-like domain-containing protein [Asticcacaulis sp. AND118]UDF04499.1 GyrI-like domain-containing protein [Asticcacaulis sp. AND118]